MEKKYIIVMVIVVALWAAFMGYRHMKKKEAAQAHRTDTYSRMIEMAKKSPRAGLYEMADALKQFYADNNTYPANLGELYPKYIASKAFIEEIDWSYEPGGNDFSLSKSTIYNNQTMVASIDSALRPEVETGGVMVATAKAPPKRRAPVEAQQEVVEEYEEAISVGTVIEVIDDQQMTVKETDVVLAAVNPELKRTEISERSENINVQRELSRIVSMVGSEAISEKDTELSYNLERYLVWKSQDGAIGVSNVQFPDREDSMFVAVKNHWYSVKRRQPEKVASAGPAEKAAETVKPLTGDDALAANYSSQYLVWKDEGGVIGFGNVQYPRNERLMVASRGEWNTIDRPPLPETTATVRSEAGSAKRTVVDDEIAADISRKYLVWKDENGVIGVGDTQYPEKNRMVVAYEGDWKVLRKEPLPKSSHKVQSGSGQQSTASEPVAAGFSGQYLVWKDKQGRIGFGNVQYPELQNVGYVHADNNWQKIVN